MANLTALTTGGLTTDVALLALAGTAVTFGMWWTYFVLPHAQVLEARRDRSFGWGYGHMPLFAAIVAVGTVLTVAVPLGVYLLGLYLFYAVISRSLGPFHLLLIVATVVVLVAPVAMAAAEVEDARATAGPRRPPR